MCRRAKTGLGTRTGTDAGLPRGKNGRGELVRDLLQFAVTRHPYTQALNEFYIARAAPVDFILDVR